MVLGPTLVPFSAGPTSSIYKRALPRMREIDHSIIEEGRAGGRRSVASWRGRSTIEQTADYLKTNDGDSKRHQAFIDASFNGTWDDRGT